VTSSVTLLSYNEGSEERPLQKGEDPLGLVAKVSIWYLVGLVEQEYRVFRVSRVQSGRITDQPGTRPASFDLAVFWEHKYNCGD
jgi:predicted DNA-binding transcriptional regulator YafY